jgi:diaminohydroxyphosphoribosylaminopyrimidine deaminase/5-amino-6-(5-phosphoribosylamino)uracil reductase
MRVTLKLATSLDGKIATASGESRWITGDAARQAAHRLRARHAAILVGVDTVIADDPELTVRLPGYVGRQPTRVVLDSRQRTPMSSKLVESADHIPTVVICASNPQLRLTQAGVSVIEVDDVDGRVDVRAAVAALEEARLTPLMVEGGGQVAASFLQAGLVDALEWFRAPIVLGDEGRPAVGAIALNDLAAAHRFRRLSVETLGEDLWERYERA